MLNFKRIIALLIGIAQRVTVLLMAGLALALVVTTGAAAVGYLPWLTLTARFGDLVVPDMGMYLQIFFTALCVSLLFYLPSHGQIMRLENSHRKFHLSMQDVANAYRLAHEADRDGLFKTGAEFDEVRERIAHLRNHPDLVGLEPDILEVAAQMSFESRELAEIYSNERVERARMFLRQRHEEMEDYRSNLKLARQAVDELKHWLTQVEADELTVSKQVDALESDLNALLPKLGFELRDTPNVERTVVPMSSKPRRDRTSSDRRSTLPTDPRTGALQSETSINGKTPSQARPSRKAPRGNTATRQDDGVGEDLEL